MRHSGGLLLLVANLADTNVNGNYPRSPLHIAEIDEDRLGVVRDTVTVIDRREPHESDKLQLSNFALYEDRQTAEVCVLVPRIFADASRNADRWDFADSVCTRYRIEVHEP